MKDRISKQITLPTGEETTIYRITQAQSIMYYLFQSYGGNSPVLNIGSGYYWQGDIDVPVFKEALYEAIERCDTMRLRFCPDQEFGLAQYIVPKTEIEIEEIDLSNMPYEEAHQTMKEWTYGMIDMFYKPLHTVRVIHLENNYHGMYIKFHHLAMDGYSVKVFLADVMAIYLNKTTGSAYPKPMKPYWDAVEQELAYLDSEKEAEDLQYFMQKFAYDRDNEPIYNDYLLDNRLYKQREQNGNPNQRYASMHEGDHPQAKSLYYEVSAEDTQAIMDTCKEQDLSVACALMTGLRTALSVFNRNEEDVQYKFMVNRRGSLLEKKSGGIRMHFFSLRTVVDSDKTFREAVDLVQEAQNDIFKHSSFHTLKMYQIMHQVMQMGDLGQTYDPMSFSYHPYMEIPAPDEETRKSSIGVWYNNDVSIQNLYLTVKHRTSDAGFEFIYEYRTDSDPREDLKVFHEKLMSAVKIGIANPEIKMKDLLEQIKL